MFWNNNDRNFGLGSAIFGYVIEHLPNVFGITSFNHSQCLSMEGINCDFHREQNLFSIKIQMRFICSVEHKTKVPVRFGFGNNFIINFTML